ncbi:MAG TPA: hypothetical protein VGK73_11330 [Polyangiaceae bacterium]
MAEDTPTPAVPAAPAQPATPPPAAATPPASTGDPDWLPGRLDRAKEEARRAVLAEIGVDDPAKAKEVLAAHAKAEEERKSAAQKLGETSEQAKIYKSEAERYKAVTTEFAARQMLGLTAEQQAAVKKIAGDDPARQLETITALTPTWAAAAPPAPATPPAPKPTTPAAGTAPPPTAAPDATNPGSPPDHKAVHAELLKSNPFLAAEYAQQYPREVYGA